MQEISLKTINYFYKFAQSLELDNLKNQIKNTFGIKDLNLEQNNYLNGDSYMEILLFVKTICDEENRLVIKPSICILLNKIDIFKQNLYDLINEDLFIPYCKNNSILYNLKSNSWHALTSSELVGLMSKNKELKQHMNKFIKSKIKNDKLKPSYTEYFEKLVPSAGIVPKMIEKVYDVFWKKDIKGVKMPFFINISPKAKKQDIDSKVTIYISGFGSQASDYVKDWKGFFRETDGIVYFYDWVKFLKVNI